MNALGSPPAPPSVAVAAGVSVSAPVSTWGARLPGIAAKTPAQEQVSAQAQGDDARCAFSGEKDVLLARRTRVRRA